MRILFTVLAATLLSAPVLAAETTDAAAVAPKRGMTLRDAKATRVGSIDRVNADGSIQIIFNSKFVTIPADKLVATAEGVSTSLTKTEVSKLR